VTANSNLSSGLAGTITSLGEKITAFTAECKENGFKVAQDRKKAATDKTAADATKAGEIKTAYELKATPPTTGAVGTICSYAIVAKDAA